MNTRKPVLGNRNLVGLRATQARFSMDLTQAGRTARLQMKGVDIRPFSLLEGQEWPVTDIGRGISQVDTAWPLDREGLEYG